MKPNQRMRILSILIGLTLASGTSWAQTAADVVPRPAAMQPGGDPNDTTRNFGLWWNGNGVVTEDFDTTMHSREDIAGSLHVVYDCPGNTSDPIASANLAFGNFFSSLWGDNTWLGAANTFDAAKYDHLEFDLFVNTVASSNTTLQITLYGYGYENVALTNLPITVSGWQHILIPIPPTINLPNCTAYGIYDWYNTTATTPPAHVEYWMDNVKLVGRYIPPPPPTLSISPVTDRGLLFDSAAGEGGQRGAIDAITDVRWAGYAFPANPVTYAMTISKLPNPAVYSNYEAHIWLAPNSGVGNPDWNLPDTGGLAILNHSDGTATARMMWKTNDPNDNTMLFNEQPGGQYGTNGYAAGTLGYLNAPSMLGTWSISFTSETDLTVRGPGGVSTNFSLPSDWVSRFTAAVDGSAYVYFGGSPNGTNNAGQPMYLSKVLIAGGLAGYAQTNDFSTLPLDTATWGLLGNETVQVVPSHTWWVKWTLPAANFDLCAKDNLDPKRPWVQLSGNTNLPVPVTTYTWGSYTKALVPSAVLPSANQTFFAARKLVATQLQVLMPGETNAPNTTTGKVGTPAPQAAGNNVTVTVNAVDANWNVVTSCSDTVHITSSDGSVLPPADAALAQGTGNFDIVFGTLGPQTVTATDVSNTAITAGTSAQVNITQ